MVGVCDVGLVDVDDGAVNGTDNGVWEDKHLRYLELILYREIAETV
jgi:hypothetical protein